MVGIFTYFICWYLHAIPRTIEMDKRTGRRATSFPMPFVFFFCLFLVGDTPAQNPQFSMADQVAQSGMVEN